jgi:hypothetical protein
MPVIVCQPPGDASLQGPRLGFELSASWFDSTPGPERFGGRVAKVRVSNRPAQSRRPEVQIQAHTRGDQPPRYKLSSCRDSRARVQRSLLARLRFIQNSSRIHRTIDRLMKTGSRATELRCDSSIELRRRWRKLPWRREGISKKDPGCEAGELDSHTRWDVLVRILYTTSRY